MKHARTVSSHPLRLSAARLALLGALVSTAAAMPRASAEIAVGSYTGNGGQGRRIDGIAFRPDLLIIQGVLGGGAVCRAATMPEGAAKELGGTDALLLDLVRSFSSDGFLLGRDARVNEPGVTYHWVAFRAVAGELGVGAYTGTGSASRRIDGLGFSPEYVLVLPAGPAAASQRSQAMPWAYGFGGGTGAHNRIISLDAGGFSVGHSAQTNAAGQTYHYAAWNAVPGQMRAGSYLGDGRGGIHVAGVGFEPQYLAVKVDGEGLAVHRLATLASDQSLELLTGNLVAGAVRRFLPDGFEVGPSPAVSSLGAEHFWVAFGSATGADGDPGDAKGQLATFQRGNANADGQLDVADAIFGVRFLFSGGRAPPCDDAADTNDDGRLDLADSLWTLRFLFNDGAPPPPPFPLRGSDPTADALPPCGIR